MKNWTLALALTAIAGVSAIPALAIETPAESATTADKPQPVNAMCPIMGGKAKDTVTTTWHDKTIGFCCKPCIAKWNALSEEQKALKLASASEKPGEVPQADQQPINAKCPIMGGKAKATVSTTWHKSMIGFCCPPCIAKWNALSEREKATKLAASIK